MDIEQIRLEKRQIEELISKLINDFIEKTELEVSDIKLEYPLVDSISLAFVNVKLSVEL